MLHIQKTFIIESYLYIVIITVLSFASTASTGITVLITVVLLGGLKI